MALSPSEHNDNKDDASSVYQDASTNDLTILTSALLLTADCMGTGILALPSDVQTLGMGVGLTFLVLNLPINLYAGSILSWSALFVEEKVLHGHAFRHEIITDDDEDRHEQEEVTPNLANEQSTEHDWEDESVLSEGDQQHHRHTDTATFDFVGMTSVLFDEPILPSIDQSLEKDVTSTKHRSITYNHPFTKLVLFTYYVNLFLVLGNYILVMSHAVSAMAGENNLCLPSAGIIASTLMFGLSQLRTMANLGRGVSFTSLTALFIVVVQCLYALRRGQSSSGNENITTPDAELDTTLTTTERMLSKMSSIAAIGFAVGSQKLLLNIRHEMKDRRKAAPHSLSIALSLCGLAYIVVCLLAGPTPPSFLFDAIPIGSGRRIAGFLLWVHVAVSYAINSQALCSSLDRMLSHSVCGRGALGERHRTRWLILTASVAVTSYLVANAVPFFKDLVALCGALTSVPLTLLLPALFYRRIQCVPLFVSTLHSMCSYALLIFSIAFMTVGLIGAVGSIDVDWGNRRGAFSCH